MKKITALAALTMAGLTLAATPAQAHISTAGNPKLAETNAALQHLADLPVLGAYAADVQGNLNRTGDRLPAS